MFYKSRTYYLKIKSPGDLGIGYVHSALTLEQHFRRSPFQLLVQKPAIGMIGNSSQVYLVLFIYFY